MKILIDLDNVLINTGEAWVERLNHVHHTTVKYDDIVDWDITKFFPSLTPEEIYKPLRDPCLWRSVKPIDGAATTMKRLIADGYDLYIVTASSPDTIGIKYNLVIKDFYEFIDMNHIIVTSSKQMIKGDVLIDDAPFNLEGGEYAGILFDAPHNRGYAELSNGFVRAKNWDDVYKAIMLLTATGGD